MNPLFYLGSTNSSLQSALANELEIERGDRLIADKAISDAHSEIDSLVKQSEEAIAQWQGKPLCTCFRFELSVTQ